MIHVSIFSFYFNLGYVCIELVNGGEAQDAGAKRTLPAESRPAHVKVIRPVYMEAK